MRDEVEWARAIAAKYGHEYADDQTKAQWRSMMCDLELAAGNGEFEEVLNCVQILKEALGL